MPVQFSNPSLQQAAAAMRKEQSNENLMKAAQALLNTKVMVPAQWDKQPEMDQNGALRFAPDTKISLMVVAGPDQQKFFPMFTDMEEVKKFYGDQQVNCLILSMDQYMPFIRQTNGEIKGIVVDPKGADVPFNTEFLEGIFKANTQKLNQNTIHKGEKILLKNVEGNIDDLEAALISCGFHEKPVKAIYLKERVEDPNEPEKTHWFIVVDTDELDTGIFTRIGNRCKPVCRGKEMEFMFANQKLGKDIAKTSRPIYTKNFS